MPGELEVDVDVPGRTLLARPSESDRALQALEESNGVLITGAPGVGKTFLAQRVTDAWSQTHPDVAVRRLGALDPGVTWESVTSGRDRSDGESPALIHIEDLDHLNDHDMHRLVHACRNGDIKLVATARTAPDVFVRLAGDGVIERLALTGLDQRDTAALVASLLDGPISAGVHEFVWRASGGHPRFVVDLIESSVAGGTMTQASSIWVMAGTPTSDSSIPELIALELAALPGPHRDLVDIVALGGPFPLTLLLEHDSDVLVDELVDAGTLAVTTDAMTGVTVVEIKPPRYRELIESNVPPARRRSLFAAAFGPIRSRRVAGTPREHLVHRTQWALSCAVTVDLGTLLDATRAAAGLGWHGSTSTLATAALGASSDRELGRVDALVLRSQARRALGQLADATVDAEAAQVALSEVPCSDDERARRSFQITSLRANLAQFGNGDVAFALSLVESAIARHDRASHDRQGDDDTPRIRLQADRTVRLAYAARFDEAGAARPAGDVLECLDKAQRIDLALAETSMRAFGGELDRAKRQAADLVEAALAVGSDAPWGSVQAQSLFLAILLWSGDLAALDDLESTLLQDSAPSGFIDVAGRQVGRGLTAAAHGDWPNAVSHFQAAVARFKISDFSGWLPMTTTWMATAYAACGRTVEAAEALASARRLPLRASGIATFDLWDHWSRVALALGDPQAASFARDLIHEGTKQRLALIEMWGWHTLAMWNPTVAAAELPTDRLTTLAAKVDTTLPATRLAHARALVEDDATMAAATHVELGNLGYWVPGHPDGAPNELTDRQLQVARLAANGLSSADIAQRLFISKRTVDAHLNNVYDRLGVHSRRDLATVLSARR